MKQMPKNNSSLVSKFLNFRYKFFLKMRWTKYQYLAFIAISMMTFGILNIGRVAYIQIDKYNDKVKEQVKVDSLQKKLSTITIKLDSTQTLLNNTTIQLDTYKDSLKQSNSKVIVVNPFIQNRMLNMDKIGSFLSTCKVTGYTYQGRIYTDLKYHFILN